MSTTTKEAGRIIDGQRWYRPMEIAKLGLIKSTGDSVSGHYRFILNQIKNGKLKTTDYSTTSYRSYNLVSESEVNRFNQAMRDGQL